MSTRTWIVAGIAEFIALNLAFTLWIAGALSGPRTFASNSPGNMATVFVAEACAAVVCLLVPGWVAHRTRHPAWWLVGVSPALFAIWTVIAVLADW